GDFVEIWNNVFMGYQRKAGREPGQFEYLEMKQKNVDTGMGVERAVAVLDGYSDVYRIDSIWELVETVMNVLKVPEGDFEEFYQDHKKSLRILVDHLRAATFILGDERGVTPSNLDQGYILRRLIRRAVRHAKKLEIPQDVCISSYLGKATIDLMSGSYPELERNRKFIIDELFKEEEKFEKTLERGLKEFEKLERVTGQDAFMLFSTYGFPLELTEELSEDKGLKIDKLAFAEEFKKHQDLSRKGGEKRFKGGLGDDSEMSKKYHTATHLLHQALKEVLGDHVEQKGSNITAERLRFDFSHPEKLTDEEKQKVEELVNQKISEALPITIEELTVDEAKASGAIGLFSDRYGDKVKVYSMGEYSKEICGGPHVKNTKDLGKFKIKKEKASSSGVRRIKAILE
ncbi:alanine--tRNA ligase, partial [Patescibacteria group bacterium]|nr:alanine--tRNA ligase [Patescibacteria group bacterium]